MVQKITGIVSSVGIKGGLTKKLLNASRIVMKAKKIEKRKEKYRSGGNYLIKNIIIK